MVFDIERMIYWHLQICLGLYFLALSVNRLTTVDTLNNIKNCPLTQDKLLFIRF